MTMVLTGTLYKTMHEDIHVSWGAADGSSYVWIPAGETIFVVAISEYYTLFLWDEKVFRTGSGYAEESQCWEHV
jgi:hypothetical protein